MANDLQPLSRSGAPAGPVQGRGAGQGRGSRAQSAGERTGSAVIRRADGLAETGDGRFAARKSAPPSATSVRGWLAPTPTGRFESSKNPLSLDGGNLTGVQGRFRHCGRFGQRRPWSGRPIELAEKQVMDRGRPRAAARRGDHRRVFDQLGNPDRGRTRAGDALSGCVQGTRRLMPTGATSQSDDTGAFRVFGLMPGDYYISATLRALQVDDPNDATNYAPTYFPGTGSVGDAQRIGGHRPGAGGHQLRAGRPCERSA